MMSLILGGSNYNTGGATAMMSSRSELMTSMSSPEPPSSPALSDSSNSPTSPSSHQRGVQKECGVCSDIAKSMHFGGLSCDSCKAFFRRSVQNNAYKGFSCPYERKCVIGVSSRKACQYCRFEKCLLIGMEKGWVMSEDERRKMMEQRKDKKNKVTDNGIVGRHHEPEMSSQYSLSEVDRSEISRIVDMYKKAYASLPYENVEDIDGETVIRDQNKTVMSLWMTFLKRMAFFFSLFPDFAELSSQDQRLLLTKAITSAGIIMGSVVYDTNKGNFASPATVNKLFSPTVTSQSVEKLVPKDLYLRISQFFKKFQSICADETMAYILILVSLYSPELMGLEAKDQVQSLQERYIHMLQNYVKYKFQEKSSVMFPKAIVSLADIRELADRTSQMRLPSDRQSVDASAAISSFMNVSSLHMPSPYPEVSCPYASPMKYELHNHTTPVGVRNDPLYRKILNYICQPVEMSSGKNPPLLPVIVQVLKKLAVAHHEGRTNIRAITGSTTRRVHHRHTKTKVQRLNKKKERRVGVTREQQQSPVMVKEEVQDLLDETSSYSPISNSPVSNNLFPTTTISEFMESFPQQSQCLQTANTYHHQQQPVIATTQQRDHQSDIAHHNQLQPMYHHQNNYAHQQADPNTSGGLSFDDTSNSLTVNTSQNYISPISSLEHYHQLQHSDIIPRGTDVLQMPPVSPFPTPQQMVVKLNTPPLLRDVPASSYNIDPYQQQSDSSSFGQMMSPYASSSSSSSPEEAGDDHKEIEINDPEMVILMDLMENMKNNDGLLKEILPTDMYNELSVKMNAFPSNGSMTTDDDDANCYLATHRNCSDFTSLSGSSYSPDIEMDIDASHIEEEIY